MSNFFNNFPKVNYDIKKNKQSLLLTNITARFIVEEILSSQTAPYYTFTINAEDRPDVVAYKYYNNANYDWVILLVNTIIDPYFEWPMPRQTFIRHLTTTYGSVSQAKQQVHEYRKIIQHATVVKGQPIAERYVVVDETTYNKTLLNDRQLISKYQHEEQQNEQRRNINLIDKQYVHKIVNAKQKVFT